MSYFDNWWKNNAEVLEHLYYELIDISKNNGIKIINNQTTINHFIKMMYYESNGTLLNYDIISEFIKDNNKNNIITT